MKKHQTQQGDLTSLVFPSDLIVGDDETSKIFISYSGKAETSAGKVA